MNILIPVDYSDNATHALNYGLQLSKLGPAKITVLHVDEVLMLTSTPQHLFKEIYHQRVQEKKEELGLYVKKVLIQNKLSGTDVNYEFADAFSFHDELVNVTKKLKTDLVIMGTKGASGIKKVFAGSNTVKAIENLHIPVLAIPEKAAFKHIHTLAYASDLKQPEAEVARLIKIAANFQMKIEIFHVHPNYPEWIKPTEETTHETLNTLKKKYPEQKFSIRLIKTENENETTEGIKTFVNVFTPDILAMFPSERSFIEKIFISSNTEEIAYEASVPLLSVPQ